MGVEQLIDQCIAGEERAVRALIEEYQPMVFGLCLRMLRHRQDAEDVTQESLLRAIRALSRWDRSRPFIPWLLAIAGNRCRTHLAKRKRTGIPSELVEEVPDGRPNWQAADHLAEEMNEALSGIREEYRQAFLFYHEYEMSYAEISEALDCPLGTVKTWVHRARRELIAKLRRRGIIEEVQHEP
ncbi:RNA polymerase subunit sigma [Planctomycetales bacterium 10988]|nr:RNA polymerase subunit sigma [Planctomycetales bacterium 10988]